VELVDKIFQFVFFCFPCCSCIGNTAERPSTIEILNNKTLTLAQVISLQVQLKEIPMTTVWAYRLSSVVIMAIGVILLLNPYTDAGIFGGVLLVIGIILGLAAIAWMAQKPIKSMIFAVIGLIAFLFAYLSLSNKVLV